jgi:hypothetical protein
MVQEAFGAARVLSMTLPRGRVVPFSTLNGARRVFYTVWSRGCLIGETDLGFARIINRFRSGWFHPNAEGERLMPIVASTLPAMRAYLHRDAVDAEGGPITRPELRGSTLFADLAEAFQHLSSLDLEVRRQDGTVVPTDDIGIQDSQQLLELIHEAEEDFDDLVEDGLDDLIDAGFDDLVDEWEPDERTQGQWTPAEDEDPQRPRYQIHLSLVRDDAIP